MQSHSSTKKNVLKQQQKIVQPVKTGERQKPNIKKKPILTWNVQPIANIKVQIFVTENVQ